MPYNVCSGTLSPAQSINLARKNLSDEVLAYVLEWGANDLHMAQLMPLQPRHLLLQ